MFAYALGSFSVSYILRAYPARGKVFGVNTLHPTQRGFATFEPLNAPQKFAILIR
jgi:hypothetical protein